MSSSARQASAAAAYATGQYVSSPRVTASHDQCRVVHRELLGSVSGTEGYTIGGTFPIQPGLVDTFPWLSNMAQSWEKYKFNSLRFQYYTRTGSSTPGSVMLVPDYDAAEVPPATEVIASSYEGTAEDAPWKDITCRLDPRMLHSDNNWLYVRGGALAANLDIKTYDAGNFYICTTDGTAVNWGKVWVEYDVTFINPQTPPAGEIQASLQCYPSVPDSDNNATTDAAFGPNWATCYYYGGTYGFVAGPNLFVFTSTGNYTVTYNVYATTVTAVNDPPVTLSSGCTYDLTIDFISGAGWAMAGDGTYEMTITFFVKVHELGPGASFSLSNTVAEGAEWGLILNPYIEISDVPVNFLPMLKQPRKVRSETRRVVALRNQLSRLAVTPSQGDVKTGVGIMALVPRK